MYIRARAKAFFIENLKAEWKGAKLILLNSNKILSKLSNREESISN